jgi:hypothetical protein
MQKVYFVLYHEPKLHYNTLSRQNEDTTLSRSRRPFQYGLFAYDRGSCRKLRLKDLRTAHQIALIAQILS